MTSMVLLSCASGGAIHPRRARRMRASLCRNPTNQASGVPAASLEPAQHEGDPQREGVTGVTGRQPGQLEDALEAVAHGVGVHEEHAAGALDGAALVEERGRGLQQPGPGVAYWQVDISDKIAPRQVVAGQGPLGEQVVAGDRHGGASASPAAAYSPATASAAETWAWSRSATTGPTTTGPSPKYGASTAPGLVGVDDPAEHHDEAVALHGAERVQLGRARGGRAPRRRGSARTRPRRLGRQARPRPRRCRPPATPARWRGCGPSRRRRRA